MKKIIFGIILTMVLTAGCEVKAFSGSNKESPKPVAKNFICFELVSSAIAMERVYRDIYTDVLYYEIRYDKGVSVTPIAKADGTFLTYTEWKARKSNQNLNNSDYN